ncbi:MAG: hypothetical protein Q7T62_18010 [Undibacterium sp.]|nr:hypothetical protein [Undibacterium sp.]
MTLGISSRQKQSVSNARKADIDAAGTAAKMHCYAAPRVAKGAAPAAAPLCSFDLTYPCGTVDAAGLHLSVSGPSQVASSGLIDWCRTADGDDNFVMDGDVRMPGDPDAAIADYLVDNSTVFAGGFVVLVSALIAEGG